MDAAIGTHNIAEVLSDQGRLEEARSAVRGVTADLASGGLQHDGSPMPRAALDGVATRSGDFEQAAELYQSAREQFQAMAAEAELIDTDARIAEALVFQQMPDQAIELATDALRRAVAQDAAQQPMLLRLRGCAHAQRGEWEPADADLQASLEVARARDARYEAALTLDAIACAAAARGGHAPEARAEADEIFASLDAVSVARAPLKPSVVVRVTSQR